MGTHTGGSLPPRKTRVHKLAQARALDPHNRDLGACSHKMASYLKDLNSTPCLRARARARFSNKGFGRVLGRPPPVCTAAALVHLLCYEFVS